MAVPLRQAAFALLAALAVHCSAGGDDDSVVPQFATVYGTILSARCSPCHSGTNQGAQAGKLDMSSEQKAYSSLVGVPAMGVSCGPSGLTRVVPGDASNSLLFLKVHAGLIMAEDHTIDAQPGPEAGADQPPCGDTMPDDGTSLTQAEVSLIEDWIDDGAKP
jgi:hypothetical protein